MCDIIMTTDGDISTISGMMEQGWDVTEQDLDQGYTSWTLSALMEEDVCLCPIDVEQVLKKNNVKYERDIWGWAIDPLKGE